MKWETGSILNEIEKVSAYISGSREAVLPAEVLTKAKHLTLDTLAAIVSGSKLEPGKLVIEYIKNEGGAEEAQVACSPIVTSAINAAMANGVMAHADETDDSHTRSRTHPGCAVVPAALAMSEREGVDGMTFLKGVVVGYDIGCRITLALGLAIGVNSTRSRSSHSIGGIFGAAAAAAAVSRLNNKLVRYLLSYTAQQTSGVTTWVRDEEHIEKAFVFGGMPARNGVTAAILVQSGFTGVWDAFSGSPSFFEAFAIDSRPELLSEGLGSSYEIMFTNIKKFPVGVPIQAPLDALLLLMEKHGFTSKDVESIVARLPSDGARVVNNRDMPDVNLQHILALTLLDGALSFEAAHSYERMNDPAVLELRKRIKLVEDPELSVAKVAFQGIVEVTTKDGAKFREHVVAPSGKAENPMTTEEVEKKCRNLMAPVLGTDRTQKLIDKVWDLEHISNVRELRPLLFREPGY